MFNIEITLYRPHMRELDAPALLKAIHEHPGEYTPRLRYADRMKEQGREDYANFIQA